MGICFCFWKNKDAYFFIYAQNLTVSSIDAYSSYSGSPAYPNPASDILNVEIGSAAKSNVQSTSTAYDIRLYDGQGNIVRRVQNKGGSVQFNVGNLPTGIYYLHIYDGINKNPEMQQIVVER